jgi:hypothetical protein
MRTRTSVRYGFVLTTEGTCIPYPLAVQTQNQTQLQPADVPSDLDNIFSSRLPDELYYYMCKGVIQPAVIGWLTTGQILEYLPLSDSREYQVYVKSRFTESPTSPRVLSLAILQDALHPQWKERRVVSLHSTSTTETNNQNAHYYFDHPNGTPLKLSEPKTLDMVKAVSTWAVPMPFLKEELMRQRVSRDIRTCQFQN